MTPIECVRELAKVQQLQREGLGLSEAVNTLARRGIEHKRADFVFTPLTYDVGVTIDITSVGDGLQLLDEMDAADALHQRTAEAR